MMTEDTSNSAVFASDENEAEKGSQTEGNNPGLPIQTKSTNGILPLSLPISESEIEPDEPFARFCSDGAHIWKQYMDRAKIWDDELANVLNGDLDPLLIFAGLFSAILSAFLIEIRKGLQEDLQDITNTLLRALVQDQHNLNTIPSTSRFEPTISSRWINGLWFSSLMFSLMSALGASLAKGWVTQYSSTGFGTAWRDASLHHRRFQGMMRWHMKVIVQGLPIFIHIAFFLFAVGLVILLFNDDASIAAVILALLIVIAALYLCSTGLTLFIPDSPFRTPVFNIISWVADRYRAGGQSAPPPVNDVDGYAFKAQALAWLLTESVDSNVIVDTVRAIAGLPAVPSVQDGLYQSSVVQVLSRGLSEYIRDKGRNLDILNAYLRAVLRLVQVGPRTSQANGDSVRNIFASMVGHGGSLHLSICTELDSGLCEIALCINARVHMVILNEQNYGALFDADIIIPTLWRPTTQAYTRQLVLEVHLLSRELDAGNRELVGSNDSANILRAIKSLNNAEKREGGHRALLAKARSEEFFIMICTDYLQKCLRLCGYEAFRRRLCDYGDIQELYVLLRGKYKPLREKTTEILAQLAKYDHTWETLINIVTREEIDKGLKYSGEDIHKALSDIVLKFAEHDGLRPRIITTDIVNSILFNLGDENNTIRCTALNMAEQLINYDDIQGSLMTPDIMNAIIMKLEDPDPHVQQAAIKVVGRLGKYDDTRAQLISLDVVQTVITMLGNSVWYVRLAASNALTELAQHRDIRAQLVTQSAMRKMSILLEAHNIDVQQAAIKAIRELARHDCIRTQLVTPKVIQITISMLRFPHGSDVQQVGIKAIGKLAKYDDIRTQLLALNIMQLIIAMLESHDSSVRYAIVEGIEELAKYSSLRAHLSPDVIQTLIKMLRDDDPNIRRVTVNALIELVQHSDIRALLLALNVTQIIIAMLRDQSPYLRQAAGSVFAELVKHGDIRAQIVMPSVVQVMLTTLNDHKPGVQQAAIKAMGALVKDGGIHEQLLTLDFMQTLITKLTNADPGVQYTAVKTFMELAKCGGIVRAQLLELGIIQTMVATLNDDVWYTRQTAANALVRLIRYEDICAQGVSLNDIKAIITKLEDRDPSIQQTAVKVIGGLVHNKELRSRIVTRQFMDTISRVIMYRKSDAFVVRLLPHLIKYDDLHAMLSGRSVINSVFNGLKTTESRLHSAYENTLGAILGIADISEAGIIFGHVLSLLSDRNPSIVNIGLSALVRLAKRDTWRKHISKTIKWRDFIVLLDHPDTRHVGLQTMRELATYDDIFKNMKRDAVVGLNLLNMTKSQAEDIERWTIGTEGLSILRIPVVRQCSKIF